MAVVPSVSGSNFTASFLRTESRVAKHSDRLQLIVKDISCIFKPARVLCCRSCLRESRLLTRPEADIQILKRGSGVSRYGKTCGLLYMVEAETGPLRAVSLRNERRQVRVDVSQASGEAVVEASESGPVYRHILVPVVDPNPYLTEGTRQVVATATALARKFSSDITVVVIDDKERENISEHDLRLKNIRWHLAEGGYEEFSLLERLGEGKMPAAVVGEVADDLGLDLVVLSMESIHSKHMDANLLAEFVPCSVLLLPL